jgi:hypothetical protein
MKNFLFLSGLLVLLVSQVTASHLMGGQITARQISGLTYEITLTAYRDTVGIPMYPTATLRIQDFTTGYDSSITSNHNGASVYINRVEVYSYVDTIDLPANAQYNISWEECCRNGAILNMSNPFSESMHFMTEVTVDGSGFNSTPVFLNPPVFLAQKYSLFQYNPLPYDADGDSLAWLLETPLGAGGDTVAGYTLPHADPLNPFTLNSLTGELTWMPDSNGFWEASFRVEEYRGGVKIGEIRRDMQIIVVDDTTNWHNIVFNNGSWPVNGQGNFAMILNPNVPFNLTVTASDMDNDPLNLTAQGEPLMFANNPAVWTLQNNVPGSITGVLSWTPTISQARLASYTVAFHGTELHNLNTFSNDQTLLLNVSTSTSINNPENGFTAGSLFPNPNSGYWMLSFELKHSSQVTVDVVDLFGKKVATVLDRQMPLGNNLVKNNNLNLTSGYYFVQVNVNGQKAVSYPMVIE